MPDHTLDLILILLNNYWIMKGFLLNNIIFFYRKIYGGIFSNLSGLTPYDM